MNAASSTPDSTGPELPWTGEQLRHQLVLIRAENAALEARCRVLQAENEALAAGPCCIPARAS